MISVDIENSQIDADTVAYVVHLATSNMTCNDLSLSELELLEAKREACFASSNLANHNNRRQVDREAKGKERKVGREPELEQRMRKTNAAESPLVKTAVKLQNPPVGFSALGIAVFHLKGRINRIDGEEVVARVDSGADITLMSEEFYGQLDGLPRPKEGIQMKLFQLTGDAKVLGYVLFDLLLQDEKGFWYGFQVEAYIVHRMTVPLLLGEDFSSSYAISQHRTETGHNHLTFGQELARIPASSSKHVELGFKIR